MMPILTIRTKVLLLSLTLLSIPYVGYEYVLEMEKYLRINLENSLKDNARMLTIMLNERSFLFNRNLVDTLREDTKDTQYVYSLKAPIQLDGYTDDWDDYLDQVKEFADKHILRNQGSYTKDSLSFQHLLGKYKGHLYALFIVHDKTLVYRDTSSLRIDQSDHLQIVMLESNRQVLTRYIVTATAPGWVSAYKMGSKDYSKPIPENHIQGTWREVTDGYILELRIPLNMVGTKLGFAVADVDNPNKRDIKTLIGTSAIYNIDTIGTVFIPSPEIEKIISTLGNTPGRRIWVLDRQRRVLAQHGDLKREFHDHPLNALYGLLLPVASEDFKDDQAKASRLEGEEVNQSLSGQADTRWRSTSDERAVIVSAAHPVWADGQVMGAVVVEETSNSIQAVQRQAIASLFNKTLLIFSIITLLLLVFATRLSARLRSLRNQAERAIDTNGRVATTKIASLDKDEIGDLSRSFSTILERLQQYNTYLEGMASRLSHELRTPIAVVRSSLENLEQEHLPSETMIYMERAKQGIDRLNTIITRLGEATRLEQALQNAEREHFDLADLVSSCVSGYRLAYPHQAFNAEIEAIPMILEGAPDLIAQMLDKLISNAVDFSEKNCPIKITLRQEKHMARLDITNQGIPLPSDRPERLFESMFSLRTPSNKKEPHLGLGLYMVRLIVGYHGGQVKARNTEEHPGAMFIVLLPLLNI